VSASRSAPDATETDPFARAAQHEAAGRLAEAETVLQQLLAAMPAHAEARHLRGIVWFRQGRVADGVAEIEAAIALQPEQALFHRNLCEIERKRGRYDAALAAGRRAVALAPEDPHAWQNLGVVHQDRLELEAAIASAERALALDGELAGAHFGIAEACLLRGDYARGWAEYEWRYRIGTAPPLMPPTDRPHWDGRALPAGERLLLIADQGYGDVIQFARYIGWAAGRCAEIAVAGSRELHPVLAQQHGVGQVFDAWERAPEFAAFCPLSGLPRLAATRLDSIPAETPYLRAEAGAAARWAGRLRDLAPPGYRRIGLAWAGRATHLNDDRRSIPLRSLAPLAALPRTVLVSLQKGPAQAQIGGYAGRAPLLNLGPEIGDWGDTMAIMAALDLMISVDTAVAHLAGAMAKPVWIALPHAPDWRWLLGRTDSPWYPTARLFRQSAARDWAEVIAAIAADLARGG
jgi:Tfp pilus assembly protein PilF